jgi:hypothetical protein
MGIKDFIQIMRKEQGSRSLREFAVAMNVSAAYLSDIYASNRLPGKKIADALGYECRKTTTTRVHFVRRKAVDAVR